MADWLREFLEGLQTLMDGSTGLTLVLQFVLALLLPPLGVLVHELGHAALAKRYGVEVRAIVAAPEGPALTLWRRGLFVRVGLGLGRELRSQEPGGFVILGERDVEPAQAIAILRAGPLAEAALGVLLLILGALPQPMVLRLIVAGNGLGMLADAFANLRGGGRPGGDGSQIRRIREHARRRVRPAPASPAWEDPHARTSVAPPGS